MSLAGVATEQLRILDRGSYDGPGGVVSIADDAKRAVAGTRLYAPAQAALVVEGHARPSVDGARARIEVTHETTATAARRLSTDGAVDVAVLNFASAKHPGGGFLGGAKAQEEDLARRSALYACLITQPAYYEANRAFPSLLYTDHLIWSPAVPFFRDDALALVDTPWRAGVVTSPAPNAGEVLRRAPDARPQIEEALARRAAQVLAVLAVEGAREIVLGAWGCGVFRNDPAFVARTFRELLAGTFASTFTRVVFAIYDNTRERRTLAAFEECLR